LVSTCVAVDLFLLVFLGSVNEQLGNGEIFCIISEIFSIFKLFSEIEQSVIGNGDGV